MSTNENELAQINKHLFACIREYSCAFVVNELESAAGAGGKAGALDPDRLRILAVSESTFVIGDFHPGEGLGLAGSSARIHNDNLRVADVGEIVETYQVRGVLGGLRIVDGGVLQDFFYLEKI